MDEIKVGSLDFLLSASKAGYEDDLKFSLKSLYSRILKLPVIEDEDNFFDLGGDSILAISLLNNIEKLTGQLLPVTTLYEASTVSALARLIAEGERPEFSYTPLLKSGTTDKPLFMVSGIGGVVTELRVLAGLLAIERAVYGLEAPGADGTARPYSRVEDLARFHVENLIAMQPEGPYYLAGYSFGGLVALEMALVLSKAGKTVALLILIDTFPHVKNWPLSQRLAGMVEFCRQFFKIPWLNVGRHYFSKVRALPFHSSVWFIFVRAWRLINFPFNQVQFGFWLNRQTATGPTKAVLEFEDIQFPTHLQNLQTAHFQAFKSYKPRYYPHELTFIRATGTSFFNEQRYWGKLCAKLNIHLVPGDHHSMLRGNPQPLALVLKACVEKASEV